MKYLHFDNRYKIIGLIMEKGYFYLYYKDKKCLWSRKWTAKCGNSFSPSQHQTAQGVFNNVYQEISLTTHLTRSLTECLRVNENFTARGNPCERWVSTPSWLGLLLASPSTIIACLPTTAFGPRLLYVHWQRDFISKKIIVLLNSR